MVDNSNGAILLVHACQDLCPEIEEHEHNSGVKMAGTVYFPVEVYITLYKMSHSVYFL